jgi:hypothetical protein
VLSSFYRGELAELPGLPGAAANRHPTLITVVPKTRRGRQRADIEQHFFTTIEFGPELVMRAGGFRNLRQGGRQTQLLGSLLPPAVQPSL